MRKCRNCGADLTDEAKFCGECGYPCGEIGAKEDGDKITDIKNTVKYKKWAGIAFMVINIIIYAATYNVVPNVFYKVAFSATFVNIAVMVIWLCVIGFVYEKAENYFQESFTKEDIWLFGIKNRSKVSMILKVVGYIIVAYACIQILLNLVSLFNVYGFSWMLLLSAEREVLGAGLAGEFCLDFSKVFDLE